MNIERKQGTLEQLLEAYPDISVERDRKGDLDIMRNKDLSNEVQEIAVLIQLQDDDQAAHGVDIYIYPPERSPERRIRIRPSYYADNTIEMVMIDDLKSTDRDDLANAKSGLEIFSAFLNLPEEERSKYADRVTDEIDTDVSYFLQELRAEQSHTTAETVLEPDEQVRYMLNVLNLVTK